MLRKIRLPSTNNIAPTVRQTKKNTRKSNQTSGPPSDKTIGHHKMDYPQETDTTTLGDDPHQAKTRETVGVAVERGKKANKRNKSSKR